MSNRKREEENEPCDPAINPVDPLSDLFSKG